VFALKIALPTFDKSKNFSEFKLQYRKNKEVHLRKLAIFSGKNKNTHKSLPYGQRGLKTFFEERIGYVVY